MIDNWIDVKEKLPNMQGTYPVMRNWNETVNACGHAYFDGSFWQPVIMDELAGAVTHWLDELVHEGVK